MAHGRIIVPCMLTNIPSTHTDQETINFHIRAIFGIETGFAGTVVSNFAKLNIESVTEETNEKHLAPWADILKASRIKSSPLTPYLDKELLYKNALSVDGTKITKVRIHRPRGHAGQTGRSHRGLQGAQHLAEGLETQISDPPPQRRERRLLAEL
ncbi:LOW QUALITY PROTEIN: hypothetical protein BC938DRAFT_483813 [Jimgerdemannia flammicorona]|uniref:Uncharacterized protein n=1 Tax=Jimgerdemannia flammicorona TaxID=994334 RepID=A0A433QVH1_9FUNG|nr:LOW QUALITY PROTEIN: hypothetical protein BC938DRAFT_483813 [Jimgerdemannia flammicorona]